MSNEWAAALGRVTGGLYVLTCRHGDRETGMLASWVQQCGFDPPAVSVVLKKGRYVADWLTAPGATCVLNVIPEGGKTLVAHFGKGFDPGEPAFAGLAVEPTPAGPALTAALAYLECRVATRADAGDHELFVLHVTGGRVLADGKPAVHTRKDGLRY